MFLAGLPLRLFVGGAAGRSRSPRRSPSRMLHDYQRKRVLIFLDPESDPLGAGYHITQSKIAIGSGGIFGKGFLNGSQSHLDYLPEGHTDFVFATMAEEWGLVGGVLLIFAFVAGDPLGDEGQRNARRPLRAARRGGPVGDDLLLRRDQPDDGDGPGAGRRHPAAAGQLRRLGGDDGHALPRDADGARPLAASAPARGSTERDLPRHAAVCIAARTHATGAPAPTGRAHRRIRLKRMDA